jgi:5-(carboxyamino)imidazole ribonucleotide synthase
MKNIYGKDFKLGILGGGQLGRMFIQEAINYNVNVFVLDPAQDAPCSAVTPHFTVGNFNDFDTVYAFGKDKDILTIEIEHVNVSALKQLEAEGVKVYPQPSILEMIKDKGLQKKFYQKHNIATAPFLLVENKQEASEAISEGPWMQKLRTGGYDGKGVTPLRNNDDLEKAFDAPSVLEKFVDFEKEIAVIVARNKDKSKLFLLLKWNSILKPILWSFNFHQHT